MALSRYSVIDAYTLEELRRQYQAADASGRIRLLAQFPKADDEEDYKSPALPAEIMRMAAEDDSSAVRQWIARNGCFFGDDSKPLTDRLITDSDTFVRACLMENHTHVSWLNAGRAFLFATHLERLALARNPDVAKADKLICKIVDLEDKDEGPGDKIGSLEKLGIDFEQRKQIALAFISNPAVQKDSRRDIDNDPYLRIDGFASFSTRDRWSKVWKLTAKWPAESGVPRAVYENVSTEDTVKAEVYEQLRERGPRTSILEGCSGKDRKTLTLGLTDPEGVCRYIAYSKIHWYDIGEPRLERILSEGDKDILRGLATNQNLPIEALKKIEAKFDSSGDYLDGSIARRTRERKEQPSPELLGKSLAEPFALRVKEQSIRFNRKLLVFVLAATGVILVLGAPLGAGLGFGLVGVALSFVFGVH